MEKRLKSQKLRYYYNVITEYILNLLKGLQRTWNHILFVHLQFTYRIECILNLRFEHQKYH